MRSARLGTDHVQPFTPLPATNLVYHQKEDHVPSLNSNEGALFRFHRLKREEIWVVPGALQGTWKHAVAPEPFYDVGLAAGKYTDILLLRLAICPPALDLDMAGECRLYVRAAYYSWGYLLRKAACDFLDVEPAELEVNIRPVTTEQGAVCEVVCFDRLENGAGYCRYLAERLSEALLQPLVGQRVEREQLEGIWTLRDKGRVRAVLTHPLWSHQHLHLRRLAARLQVETTVLPCCTLFDALHRPGWCVGQLGS